MFAISQANFISMTTANASNTSPWQLAYMIWGVTNTACTCVYIIAAVIETGSLGIGTGLIVGLVIAVASLPSLLPFGLLLPKLLIINSVSARRWAVTAMVICTFLLLASPFVWLVYLENNQLDALRPLWQTFCLLFIYLSPYPIGALVATGYYCRFWLFNKPTQQDSY